jgi:hypothetical protein
MNRKLIGAVAMCATALSSMGSSPAFATPGVASSASSETETAMANQCSVDLGSAVNTSATTHDGTPVWSTVVAPGSSSAAAATENGGTRDETPGSRFGTGGATYTNLSIGTDPYRIGGSVNMFGDQVATQKNWSGSEYDFTADYNTVTTFSYACNVSELTEHYVAPTGDHGSPVQGYFAPRDDNDGMHQGQGGGDHAGDNGGGNEGDHTNACNMYNDHGPTWSQWGEDQGNCMFVVTAPAVPDTYVEGYWVNDGTVDHPELTTTHTVDQTDTDYDVAGHEVNGGPWSQQGSWFAAQVVICISPGKKGGTWTTQNGYTGSKCTTTYFNEGHWSHGSQTSNGTYISVPSV